ncbi:MAG: hypothetical protein NVS4B7_01230 [Ktedonobacteraceae bacterium]
MGIVYLNVTDVRPNWLREKDIFYVVAFKVVKDAYGQIGLVADEDNNTTNVAYNNVQIWTM